jgi:serine protease Do
MCITSEDRPNKSSRQRLRLLGSAAAIVVPLLLLSPIGYLEVGKAAPVTESSPARSTGPASFAAVVQRVKPAVMSIRVRVKTESPSLSSNEEQQTFPKGSPFEKFFKDFGIPSLQNRRGMQQFALAQGSGFFISPDGYAVTNDHVVNNAQSVEVTTDDGKIYPAKVVGTDPKTDVALLKIDGRSDFPYAEFASTDPQIGDWVIAVGNPYGLGGTVTAGIVSARGRDIGAGPYDDFIQVDAPMNKGNSGGPAFNESGKVVGMTSAIYSPSGGSIGIGFAIPAETVKSVVAQLRESGTVIRGWIGVQVQGVTPDIADSLGLKQAEGALVTEPQPDSPATKAGIASGDLIQSVNDEKVKDSRDLARKIAAIKPGTRIKVGFLHNGSPKALSLTVEKMPNEKVAEKESTSGNNEGTTALGLTLAPASSVAGMGSRGVAVTNVNPGGPAAEHGIRTGDVILDVSGKAVNTPSDVRDAISAAHAAHKHAF